MRASSVVAGKLMGHASKNYETYFHWLIGIDEIKEKRARGLTNGQRGVQPAVRAAAADTTDTDTTPREARGR